MRTACYVIKFGGSITTNKNGSYNLLRDSIITIAKNLNINKVNIRLPLVLIFGGGSFGNLAPVDYRVLDQVDGRPSVNLPMMTTVMFSMLSEITKLFVQHSVAVYPFQSSAIIGADDDGKIILNTRAISSAMTAGYIPILTGDLIFKGNDTYEIFSSDNIPPLMASHFEIVRALYYTDVDGLYQSLESGSVVPLVDNSNSAAMQELAGKSSAQDFTGGMQNKFIQQRLLAKLGIESEVLSFQNIHNVEHSLRGDRRYGTVFLPG